MQMLFAAMLVHAFHAALEDRIVAFNRVGGDGGRDDLGLAIGAGLVGNFVPVADIFVLAVVHGVVAGEVLANLIVPFAFVGIDRGFFVHVGADNRSNFGK